MEDEMTSADADRVFEFATGIFSVQLAILSGLAGQQAIDRVRLAASLKSLVDDLSPGERQQPYGFLLGETIEWLSMPAPSKSPSRLPGWYRGTIDGGRSEDDEPQR
jgi:hypothetical protein